MLVVCVQVDDNIPLRVMLLLMDEVFDLKEKNQWLRRNIKNLLQQLIRATYGDTINRSEHRLNAVHRPWRLNVRALCVLSLTLNDPKQILKTCFKGWKAGLMW